MTSVNYPVIQGSLHKLFSVSLLKIVSVAYIIEIPHTFCIIILKENVSTFINYGGNNERGLNRCFNVGS